MSWCKPLTHVHLAILLGGSVILELTTTTIKADLIIVSNETNCCIILMFLVFLVNDGLIVLVLRGQVKQGVGRLHVPHIVVLRGHHDELSFFDQYLDETFRQYTDEISSVVDDREARIA